MALLDVPAQAVALATFVISPEGMMKPAVFGSITVREGAPPRKPGQLAASYEAMTVPAMRPRSETA